MIIGCAHVTGNYSYRSPSVELVEEGQARSETSGVEDNALLAQEEEGTDGAEGETGDCQLEGAQQKFVEAVVCVEYLLLGIGKDVLRNSQS
jgi:hypothetical protein